MDTILMQKVLPYTKQHFKHSKNRKIAADTIAWLMIAKDSVYKTGLTALAFKKDSAVNQILSQMPFPEVREFYQCIVKELAKGITKKEAEEYTLSFVSKQGMSKFSSYLCCLICEGLIDIFEIGKLRPQKKKDNVLTAKEIERLLIAFSKSEAKAEAASFSKPEKQQDAEVIAQEEKAKAESAQISRGFKNKLWCYIPQEWQEDVQKIYVEAEEKREIEEAYRAMMEKFDDAMKFPEMDTKPDVAFSLQRILERMPSEPLWNLLDEMEEEEVEIVLMHMPFLLRKRMYMGIYPENRQKKISTKMLSYRLIPALLPKEEARKEVLKRIYETILEKRK